MRERDDTSFDPFVPRFSLLFPTFRQVNGRRITVHTVSPDDFRGLLLLTPQ